MLNVGSCEKLNKISVVRSCGKLQQSVGSNEKSLLKGKRDREYERVLHTEQERFMSEKRNVHDTFKEKPEELFKVHVWLIEDSLKLKWEWTGKVWERRNLDMALHETNRQLKPENIELYHTNQLASQPQMENQRILEESATKSRLYQESHAKDCFEIED